MGQLWLPRGRGAVARVTRAGALFRCYVAQSLAPRRVMFEGSERARRPSRRSLASSVPPPARAVVEAGRRRLAPLARGGARARAPAALRLASRAGAGDTHTPGRARAASRRRHGRPIHRFYVDERLPDRGRRRLPHAGQDVAARDAIPSPRPGRPPRGVRRPRPEQPRRADRRHRGPRPRQQTVSSSTSRANEIAYPDIGDRVKSKTRSWLGGKASSWFGRG